MRNIENIDDNFLPIEGRPTVLVEASNGVLDLNFTQLWQYRELLYFFIWRDLKVRYKQTFIGATWAILQPLLTMIIFAVIFGNFARLPSNDVAYPIFVYAALIPWTYFSQAVERSSNSMVENARLITKVYFPRLLVPVAAVMTPIVDSLLSLIVLLPLMLIYKVAPTPRLLILPVFLMLAMLLALSISLWLSALNVRYRDVRYIIPFMIQIGLYGSPVAYAISLVPDHWLPIYSLNPMVGVIEGFRWSLLGEGTLNLVSTGISTLMALVLLIGGIIYFNYVERTFADVI